MQRALLLKAKSTNQSVTKRNIVDLSKLAPGIANITLSNAPVNSLTRDTFIQLESCLDQLENEDTCDAVIISSSQKVFSSGLDLRILSKPNVNQLTEYWQSFQSVTRKIYNSRLLTVAGMSGHAIAGGCILALCCDERVLNKEARIGLNEATFGIVAPEFAAGLAVDVLGRRQAERALTFGSMFNAETALKIGLVDDVYCSDASLANQQEAFLKYCSEYALRKVRPASGPVHGRAQTKAMLHKEWDKKYFGTPELIQKDTLDFVSLVMHPKTQSLLETYLASLSKKK